MGRPVLGGRLFLFVFIPLSTVISTAFVSVEMRHRLVPDVFDRAGQFVHGYLSAGEASRLTVVSPSVADGIRTMFYIDQPNTYLVTLPEGRRVESKSFAGDQRVLAIGTYSMPGELRLETTLNGYSLLRVIKPYTVDFRSGWRRAPWLQLADCIRGRTWGAWSSNRSVVLECDNVLPRNVVVHLTAIAFGPNVGKAFMMQLGSRAKTFSLSETAREVHIPFDDVAGTRKLTIVVPNPTSPREIGFSADGRKLGIGLIELRVEVLNK